VKGNALRVYRPFWRGTRRKSPLALQGSETAHRRSHARGLSHALLPALLASALSGMTLAGARAQDAPKPADKPASTDAGKVAQAAPAQPAPAQPAQPAPAPAAPAGPAPGSVTYSGLVDIYYGINTRSPAAAVGNGPFTGVTTVGSPGEFIGVDNFGRAFDINDRTPSFSLGEINIVRTANKSLPIGITATLTVGDTARLVHANEPGGTSSWQTLQQLYFTYTSHWAGRDMTWDFGKFVTPFGNEVIESSSNDNYSRSFGFVYAVPLYHAGLRLTTPLNSRLSLVAGLVNGWNDVADDNNGKSAFGQLTWKPSSNVTTVFGYMGGPEGTGAFGSGIPTDGGGSIGLSLGEFIGTWQANSKLKLVVEADHARGAGTVLGVPVSGSWVEMAGYARYQLTPKIALAARVEQFEDIPGANGLGLHFGGYTKLNSATLTAEYLSLRGHLVSRLEYRHDHSNYGLFGTASGVAVSDQDTIYLGEVYKF